MFILPDPSQRGILQHYCQITDTSSWKAESSLKAANKWSEIQNIDTIPVVAPIPSILQTREKSSSIKSVFPSDLSYSLVLTLLLFLQSFYRSILLSFSPFSTGHASQSLCTFLLCLMKNWLHSDFSAQTTGLYFIGFCQPSNGSEESGEKKSDLLVLYNLSYCMS